MARGDAQCREFNTQVPLGTAALTTSQPAGPDHLARSGTAGSVLLRGEGLEDRLSQRCQQLVSSKLFANARAGQNSTRPAYHRRLCFQLELGPPLSCSIATTKPRCSQPAQCGQQKGSSRLSGKASV